MEDLKPRDPVVPGKCPVHRLPSLPVVVHPLFPSCSIPDRHHTFIGSFRTQTLLLLFLLLGGRRFSLVCIQPRLRIKEIPERAYLVACRLMVDLHAQTLLDSSAGRSHLVFPFLRIKIVVKGHFFCKFQLLVDKPLFLKVDFLNIHTANKHSFSRFIVLIIFKDK